jgi:fibronectin-binding autotransporter adhesin
MAIHEVDRKRRVFTLRNGLAAGLAIAFALILDTAVGAATIIVNSLADTGGPGICLLRNAINAANAKTRVSGCAAGTGHDTITFSVTGTIALERALPKITASHLTIIGPSSGGITIDGGGEVPVMVVAPGATVKLDDLTIANGLKLHGNGGGVHNNGTLTVINCTFSGNRTSAGGIHGGGGIYNDGTLTVTGSTFLNNSANSGSGSGGGIFNAGGRLTVNKSTFSSNSAFQGGGIFDQILVGHPTMTVTNSTFSDNIGFLSGGAIRDISDEGMTVTNSTFSGNSGGSWGGAIDCSSTLRLTNSTFSSNTAPDFGSAIFSLDARVKSTIVAASHGAGNCSGTITDVSYNISDDTSCGFAKTGSANNGDGVDPLLSPAGLADNGGPTMTIALLDGSPAIDVIPVADCTDQASPPNQIHRDQRGFPRPDNGESACDISAYEFQGSL